MVVIVLDVAFLMQPIALDRHIVYRYRSGALLGRIFQALQRSAAQNGLGLDHRQAAEVGKPMGLLPQYLVHSLGTSTKYQDQLFDVLETSVEEHGSAFFIASSNTLFDSPQWQTVQASCVVVDEVELSRVTLPATLQFLEKDSGLFNRVALKNSEALHEYMTAVAVDRRMSLDALIAEFARVVLLNFDPETGLFPTALSYQSSELLRSAVMWPLQRLLTNPTPESVTAFIAGVEPRDRNGCSASEVLDGIYVAATRLIELSGDPDLQTSLLLWGSVILAYEGALLTDEEREASYDLVPKLFLTNLSIASYDYVERFLRRDTNDPLLGLETLLTTGDAEGSERERLILAMRRCLSTREFDGSWDEAWFGSLARLLMLPSSVGRGDAGDIRPHFSGPKALTDIVGQKATVDAMIRRVRANDHARAVLLFGPDGVGKATLARLYAKMLLCQDVTESGPCCACGSCASFDNFSIADFIDQPAELFATIDPNSNGKTYAQTLPLRLRSRPIENRWVVVITDVNRAPSIIEPLLKTLEAESDDVTFIITARGLDDLSDAGQSRCHLYRLNPLTRDDTATLASRFLQGDNSVPSGSTLAADERCCELLAAVAEGNPSRLAEACDKALQAGARNSTELRAALQLPDASWTLGYWKALFDPAASFDQAMEWVRTSSVDETSTVGTIAAVLNEIRQFNHGRFGDSALVLGLSRDALNQLARMIAARAQLDDIAFDQLWSELTKILAQEFEGVPHLEHCTRKLRRLLVKTTLVAT